VSKNEPYNLKGIPAKLTAIYEVIGHGAYQPGKDLNIAKMGSIGSN
jgi:hypothetical protein